MPALRPDGPCPDASARCLWGRVRFLTVAFEGRNDPRRVRRFAEQHTHTWPYLMGNDDVARAYGLLLWLIAAKIVWGLV